MRTLSNSVMLVLWMIVLTSIVSGQVLFTETFEYQDGGLADCSLLDPLSPYYPVANNNVSGGIWVNNATSTFPCPILVQTGALTYPGYSLSGLGKKVFLPRIISSSQSAYRTFTASPVVYYSAMVIIDSAYTLGSNNPSDPNYDLNGTAVMAHGSSSSTYRGLLVYNRVSNSDPLKKIVVGVCYIRDDPGTAFATAKPLDTLQTHLIVVRTERATGTSKLWVNPDLSGPEPTPDAVCTNTSAADLLTIDRLILYQRDSKPTSRIGGIRVGTTWAGAVIPVELTSFTVSESSAGVELKWTTATELNNRGFAIERKKLNDWDVVGFVEGSGTSTSPNEYAFSDRNISAGKYSYRLKQIDVDGEFKYSQEIEIEISAPKEFRLEQNYPNPFNPTTMLNYQLPETNHIILKIFDALGIEVATLVNEVKEAGSYSSQFNASILPSGIYFAMLQYNGKQLIQKMILMK